MVLILCFLPLLIAVILLALPFSFLIKKSVKGTEDRKLKGVNAVIDKAGKRGAMIKKYFLPDKHLK